MRLNVKNFKYITQIKCICVCVKYNEEYLFLKYDYNNYFIS